MTAPPQLSGHCLCGKVEIVLAEPSAEVEICQCGMCRRWGGAFFAAQTGADATVTGHAFIAEYQSSDWATRAFCKECGSGLWFRFLPTGTRSFSAGLFDDAAKHAVGKEIFVDERAAWCRIEGNHPRQTGEEVIAEAKAAGFEF